MIHLVILLLVLFIRLENSESLQIHQLSSYSIDLLIDITAELSNKKTSIRPSDHIFDDEFFEEFDSRSRAEEFDEIQVRIWQRYTVTEYMGKKNNCKKKMPANPAGKRTR